MALICVKPGVRPGVMEPVHRRRLQDKDCKDFAVTRRPKPPRPARIGRRSECRPRLLMGGMPDQAGPVPDGGNQLLDLVLIRGGLEVYPAGMFSTYFCRNPRLGSPSEGRECAEDRRISGQ